MSVDVFKFGAKEILQILTDDEIMGLAFTVTQNLSKDCITNRIEAEEAILIHSPDVRSILERKCITRDILFKYAHNQKVPVVTPVTKSRLIDIILKYWTSKYAIKEEEPINNNNTHNEVAVAYPPAEITVLANQFSRWFYSQMNSENPIGSEHFWADCVLRLQLKSSTNVINNDISNNPEKLSSALFDIKSEHGLYFNPNYTSEGVQGHMDPHGLVIVMVCGTLHKSSLCVGIFEQIFGLTRDPFAENNWKIKYTYLNLLSKENVTDVPRISESSFSTAVVKLKE